jgi:putative component of toxin-antitoxin plasmid stabilization module
MENSYRQALEESKRELRELVAKRDRINMRIDKVQTGMTGLVNMLSDSDEALAELSEINEIVGPIGTTEVIRSVYRSKPKRTWTPVAIRDYLLDQNFDILKYSNPLAAIHTILRRLERAGEIEPVGDVVFGGGYRWKGTPESERERLLRQGKKRLGRRLSFGEKTVGPDSRGDFGTTK